MQKKQRSRLLVVIIIVLVIGLLGVLGYLFWQNVTNKSGMPTVNSKSSSQSSSGQPTTDGPKIFKGDGYTADYLGTWTAAADNNPDGPSTIFTSPDYKPNAVGNVTAGAIVRISVSPSSGDLLAYVQDSLTQVGRTKSDYVKTTVGGQVAYSYNFVVDSSMYYNVITSHGGNFYLCIYRFAAGQHDTYESGFNTVLNHFMFS
jgi:hypothetical protein